MIYRKSFKSPHTKDEIYNELGSKCKIKELPNGDLVVWSAPTIGFKEYAKEMLSQMFENMYLKNKTKEFVHSTIEFLLELLIFITVFISRPLLIIVYPINLLTYKIFPAKVTPRERIKA